MNYFARHVVAFGLLLLLTLLAAIACANSAAAANNEQIIEQLSNADLSTNEMRQLIDQLQGDQYKTLIEAGQIDEANCNEQFYRRVLQTGAPFESQSVQHYLVGRALEHQRYCSRQYLTHIKSILSGFDDKMKDELINFVNYYRSFSSRQAAEKMTEFQVLDAIFFFAENKRKFLLIGVDKRKTVDALRANCAKLSNQVEPVYAKFAEVYKKNLPKEFEKFVIISSICSKFPAEITDEQFKERRRQQYTGLMYVSH